jgi:hypothetical protein
MKLRVSGVPTAPVRSATRLKSAAARSLDSPRVYANCRWPSRNLR